MSWRARGCRALRPRLRRAERHAPVPYERLTIYARRSLLAHAASFSFLRIIVGVNAGAWRWSSSMLPSALRSTPMPDMPTLGTGESTPSRLHFFQRATGQLNASPWTASTASGFTLPARSIYGSRATHTERLPDALWTLIELRWRHGIPTMALRTRIVTSFSALDTPVLLAGEWPVS